MDKEFEFKNFICANDNLEVPDKISEGIDDVLKKINTIHRRKVWKKGSSIAAALILSAVIGLGVAFPALASEIPIVNKILGKDSVFNKINNSSANDFKNLKGVQNNSVPVEQMVTENNIKVEMKELAYDGTAIYLAYTISGDINTKDLYAVDSKLEAQGKQLESGAFIREKIDEKTILVKQVYPLSGKDKLPPKLHLTYKITSIQDKAGNWEFNYDIRNINDLAQNIKRNDLNRNIILGPDKAKILSLVESPAYATLTVQYDNYKPDSYYFALMDDEGNEFQKVDLGKMTKEGKKTIVTFYYKRINLNRVSRIILVQPQKDYFESENIQEKTYIGLKESLPKIVSIGDDKSLIIKGISSVQGNLEITFEARNIPVGDFVFHGGINILNRDMDEEDHKAYSFGRVETLGNYTYKAILKSPGEGRASLVVGNYKEVIKEVEEIKLQ